MGEKWDLAGYSTVEGRIEKNVPHGLVLVPGLIWLDKRNLNWRLSESAREPTRFVVPSNQLLDRFVRVWELRDQEILAFAKQNGVLGLHVLEERNAYVLFPELFQAPGKDPLKTLEIATEANPASRIMGFKPSGTTVKPIKTRTLCGIVAGPLMGTIVSVYKGREPLAEWRRISRKIWAMLNIAASVAGNRRIDRDDWRHVWHGYTTADLERLADPISARAALFMSVTHELRSSSLTVGWNRNEQRIQVQLDYHGSMLAAIGLQLAMTISDSDNLYCCSGCGGLYFRSAERRRPRPDQSNFCDKCSAAGMALRRADARRRGKVAQARELYRSGIPLREIAKRLDTDTACVRRWVGDGRK